MLMMIAMIALMQDPEYSPRGSPTDEQFEAVRRGLNVRLLDYPSARFRDVRADDSRICGYVNAKNSVGAYTGWKPFGSTGVSSDLVWIDDKPMLELFCTEALMATERDYSDRLRADP